ncbi:Ankyrin repeat, PH and SEC7 domain containing protein secG, partial [Colletotrichum shisoi]
MSTLESYYDILEPYLGHGNKPGDKQYLAHILETWNPNIDPENDIGWALHWSVYQGDDAAVQMMLDAGVDPNTRDKQDPGFTPLLAASQHGGLEMARLFWERVGPDGRFIPKKRGRSAGPDCLQIAARNNHADLTTYFLGAWDGWDDDEKRRALLHAASAWCDDAVTVLLTHPGISYSPEDIQDALVRAVGKRMILPEHETKPAPATADTTRQQQLVSRLVDAGGDPDGEDRRSHRPLIHATILSQECIGGLRGLLEKGANPNRPDSHGKTALHYLFSPLNRQLPATTALELLLLHGALPELADEAGETPLHVAAKTGTCEQLQLCLSHCRAPNAETIPPRNPHGESLLHYAAVGGRRTTVEFLLNSGLDANVASSNGWTPLLCALSPTALKTAHEMCLTANFLLQHGAGAGVVTDEGWTALHAMGSWPAARDSTIRAEVANLAKRLIESGAPVGVKSRVIRSLSTTAVTLCNVWGFRMRDFNPILSTSCTFITGNLYCIKQNWGAAPEPAPPSTTAPGVPTTLTTTTTTTITTRATTTTTTPGNGVATPTPIQPGIVSNCNKSYFVASGASCSKILSYNGITLANIVEWKRSSSD